MPARKRVKMAGDRPLLVGVIATAAELRFATAMSSPPDLFELRLDWLFREPRLEETAKKLKAPLIVTARHTAEGGNDQLPAKSRIDLLLRFLPMAAYVDIELRSARLSRAVIERARRLGVGTIISFHDFESTPSAGSLRAKATRAAGLRPALFKVATRTDSAVQLNRLLEFISRPPARLRVCAMGMGRLGPASRLLLAQCGSTFIYTSLKKPRVDGQVSLAQFRTALRQLRLFRQ